MLNTKDKFLPLRPDNYRRLNVNAGIEKNNVSTIAFDVSKRFIHTASILPENNFIGLQLSSDGRKSFQSLVFSSADIKITEADVNWVFQGYAVSETGSYDMPEDLFWADRSVYILSSILGDSNDPSAAGSKRRWTDETNRFDSNISCEYFGDMFNMLLASDAAMRIVAGPADPERTGHGTILISLSEEMPVRLRSVLTLVFPHLTPVNVEALRNGQDKHTCLSDDDFFDGLSRTLEHLMGMLERPNVKVEETEQFSEVGDEEEEKPEEESSFTPLDDMELSVRSYICLKRAGIDSVEQLRAMSDEDLRHVRSITRKNFAEIKEKLAEMQANAISLPRKRKSFMDMLQELVGLSDVKEHVRKIAAFAKMKKDMKQQGREDLTVAFNMAFVGNPGTAKTTVARILAGVFNEIGILSSKELIEVGRADLVGRYEGQTASNVQRIFSRAKGKVLFIDEAYSLVEQHEGEYGDEAINTIVQEMENNREDTIVIFAGYPDKMEGFFARNPGLRSRVPFTITFKDYSIEEMLEIVEVGAKKQGFTIDPQAKNKLSFICGKAVKNPEAGNGRFCRNLVEKAILSYASRVYGQEDTVSKQDFVLAEEDFSFPETLKDSKKTQPIGFTA